MRLITTFLSLALTIPAAAEWSGPRALTETQARAAGSLPTLATNGEVIVGAWSSDDFATSIQVQRWSMEGVPLEPFPLVVFPSRVAAVSGPPAAVLNDVVWTGSEFLVIWSQQSVHVERFDAAMRKLGSVQILQPRTPRLVKASSTEILILNDVQAELYDTDGRFIRTAPLGPLALSASPDRLDAVSNGERFLVAAVGKAESSSVLEFFTIGRTSRSQPAVQQYGDAANAYAIDAATGNGTFLVTTVTSWTSGDGPGGLRNFLFDRRSSGSVDRPWRPRCSITSRRHSPSR